MTLNSPPANSLSQALATLRPLMNGVTPKLAIVLGSGLGPFVERLKNTRTLLYRDIPGFLSTTVVGHQGKIIFGDMNGLPVVCLQGRIHAYEGHDQHEVTFPMQVLKALGVPNVLLTNAAGGVNPAYRPGDLVLITDHINLTGRNPLVGKNNEDVGPRFPDMTETYNLELRKMLQSSAKSLDLKLQSGVYCGVLGPSYETPAEVKMIRLLGGDIVGMSTVPESIYAHYAGLKVAGISCVTNMAAGLDGKILRHEDIKEQAEKVMYAFSALIEHFCGKLL